jgi:hypothetical protein
MPTRRRTRLAVIGLILATPAAGVTSARPARAQVCVTITVVVNGSPTPVPVCQPLLDQYPTLCTDAGATQLGFGGGINVCRPAPVAQPLPVVTPLPS